MTHRNPSLSVVIQIMLGTIVDHFMANRPLNVMLNRLVDRNGQIVHGPADIYKRLQMFVERDPHDNVAGVHMRLHRGDLLSTSTILGEMISGRDWDDALDAPFETTGGIKLTVRQDKMSGWMTIHFKELDELLGRVGELRVA